MGVEIAHARNSDAPDRRSARGVGPGHRVAWTQRPCGSRRARRPGERCGIREAESRMGLVLPAELREWLLANDSDAGRQPSARSPLVALGCEIDLPGGHTLLGLTDIQRVYLSRMGLEEMQPSADPDCPFWRREWVPIAAETDGLYGTFLDARTGTVGNWAEAEDAGEGVYASLSAFFHETADRLEGVSSGDWSGPGRSARPQSLEPRPQDEPIRLWARANGYSVNDRGRVPASIRDAYEAARM
ncbi:histone-like nucleoid-structuring protein Lsr2 [Streptomyces sp. NPDC101776]|uniref:Lsr2 family DNA-binding protein n=1 Tax=Streptomyces sp. NPDC101776 TaxID=3366146 RepID=UPI00382AE5E5